MARTHPLEHVEKVLVIGIGGFAGSNLRYFIESVVPSSLVATVVVNVLGCLALGFFLYEQRFGGTISQPSRTVLATGFVSSFTTYSTFVVEAIDTVPVVALGFVAGSYATGFAAVLVGREGARWVTRTVQPATEVSE